MIIKGTTYNGTPIVWDRLMLWMTCGSHVQRLEDVLRGTTGMAQQVGRMLAKSQRRQRRIQRAEGRNGE